jgi:hypothetical protein
MPQGYNSPMMKVFRIFTINPFELFEGISSLDCGGLLMFLFERYDALDHAGSSFIFLFVSSSSYLKFKNYISSAGIASTASYR